jgi:UrcA family protein
MSAIKVTGQSMRSMRVRALVLVGCVLGIGSSLAHAAPATEAAPSVKVQYSAFDLASDEAASNLYRRIATAAQTVCPDASPHDLNAFTRSRSCQSEAIARAVRDVRSPRLAEVYNARANHG